MKAAIISLGSESSKWTAEAMKKYFKKVDTLDVRNIEVNLGKSGAEVLYKGEPIEHYDCIYPKGSFKYAPLLRSIVSSLSDDCYIPIKASAFTIGHDKLLTHLKLQKSNIPMPITYISPTVESTKTVFEKVNYPIVMKFPQGTQGKGVMFADSFASASSLLDAMSALKQPVIIQEYVESGGCDIRAFVVGGKVVAAMKRKAEEGEKRANIHAGGKGEAYELDSRTRKIAIQTAEILGCDICGVDILESVRGPVVIEVNVSPGLQGITEATKIDVADKIAKHLYTVTKETVRSGKVESTSKMFEDLGIKGVSKKTKEIITNLDFRSDRILLPEVVTDIAKFNEKHEVSIKTSPGRILIKRFDIGEEK